MTDARLRYVYRTVLRLCTEYAEPEDTLRIETHDHQRVTLQITRNVDGVERSLEWTVSVNEPDCSILQCLYGTLVEAHKGTWGEP